MWSLPSAFGARANRRGFVFPPLERLLSERSEGQVRGREKEITSLLSRVQAAEARCKRISEEKDSQMRYEGGWTGRDGSNCHSKNMTASCSGCHPLPSPGEFFPGALPNAYPCRNPTSRSHMVDVDAIVPAAFAPAPSSVKNQIPRCLSSARHSCAVPERRSGR